MQHIFNTMRFLCRAGFTCSVFGRSLHWSSTIMLSNVFDCHWHFSLIYISFMHKYDKPFNGMIFSCKIVVSANISFHLLFSRLLRHFA